jgi:hypothetical protein
MDKIINNIVLESNRINNGNLDFTNYNKFYTEFYREIYKINKPKVVIYIVNLGGYDTDKKHDKWVNQTYPNVTIKKYFNTDEVSELDISDARNNYEASKKWRLSAHILKDVKDADFAIYIDSNVVLTNPNFVDKLLKDWNDNTWDMLMSPHETRNTHNEEAEACIIGRTRYTLSTLEKYKAIRSNNFLCWCGFNIRWLKSPNKNNVIKLMDYWWSLIKDDSYGISNDQIVWPIALDYADVYFPIKFSRNWQKEYNYTLDGRSNAHGNENLFITVTHNKLLSRKAKLPLRNGKPVDEIMIYIIYYKDEQRDEVEYNFRSFYWAVPYKLQAQNCTFENVFWTELKNLKNQEDQWNNSYKMIGNMGYKASACNFDDTDVVKCNPRRPDGKINIVEAHKFIDQMVRQQKYNYNYFHFADSGLPIPNMNTKGHGPEFEPIWFDTLEKLNLPNVTEAGYNFWMCTPKLMDEFINWYETEALPTLVKNPHIMDNANYGGNVKAPFMKILCNQPGPVIPGDPYSKVRRVIDYYPMMPFILERLTKSFFVKKGAYIQDSSRPGYVL